MKNRLAFTCFYLIIFASLYSQEKSVEPAGEKKEWKEIFVKTNGEFVTHNVMAANLILPGSGNMIYAAAARKSSTVVRTLTFVLGMWSLYRTADYVYQHFDRNNSTPTLKKTQLFLVSYIAGNLLNYKRLCVYNRKNNHNLRIDCGLTGELIYVGFAYRF